MSGGASDYKGAHRGPVIVLSFGNDFGLNSPFLNFFNFYFLLRLVMTPHVLHDHMIYVYSFSLCFMFLTLHNNMAKRSHYHIMIFSTSEFYSTDTPHPHFPLLPPLSHHPNTHHQCLHSMGQPRGECD